MERKTLQVLEYDKILARLAGFCDFSASSELARALQPTSDCDEATRLLNETSEARLLLSTHDMSVGGSHDIRPAVDLAVRGYIKIEEKVDTFLLFHHKDYVFHLLKPSGEWGPDLSAHERVMLDNIFAGGGSETRLSSLKNRFYTALPTVREDIMAALKASVEKGPLEIRFNPSYMIDALRCIDASCGIEARCVKALVESQLECE